MHKVILFSVIIIFCIQVACDSKLADSPEPAYLKLLMTVDTGGLTVLPNDSLLVNIASIRFWRGKNLRDWAVISDTNRVYNLFNIEDDISIANTNPMFLPPGDYHRLTIRMLLSDTTIVLGGRRYSAHIPTENLQIVNIDEIFNLEEGEIFNLNIVFNAEESLTYKLGKYIFVPTFTMNWQNY